MLSQASQWLVKHWKSVKLIPESQDDSDLFNVVARWVTFEEIDFASFLLLDIKVGLFAHTSVNKCLHETFRIDR